MASNPPGDCCRTGSLHEGTPTGQDIRIADGTIEAYLAVAPEHKAKKGQCLLYLPDVISIWQNSKLMADQFAEEGYTCLIIDLFNGDAMSLNPGGSFDFMSWMTQGTGGNNPHTKAYVDPIVVAGIQHLQSMGFVSIGAIGYCFGAKYVVRHFKSGIDVGYVAHPSFVEEEELASISGPLSICAAQTDSIFTTEQRHKSEEILIETNQPWQINLYSQVSHGFAVRCDLTNKHEMYRKEQAFAQAIAWFNHYLPKP